ncbi:hypothetical protein Mesau_05587 [Mesorhizobium australicum WSM2073]|uniref:Uncharacterized protein n=3 Tax=Mesorhizobium TaxID=68287 RepID=L0KR48_MESAW|nr:hypothetical protein Mesci_5539 [Mesorhizobium ciceri biovar biserrulae WSM1271]AEH90521.1 hypothetical protein Mesop_6120 [Mesorhizobium opportunistum WSM2075]AGB47892.1 hypothetical protein Mesau_05587 [Mesorhizobium australicum WSM2073]OBP90002.1 hypothetical protein BAE40_13990 [Mesorhizobium loti]
MSLAPITYGPIGSPLGARFSSYLGSMGRYVVLPIQLVKHGPMLLGHIPICWEVQQLADLMAQCL